MTPENDKFLELLSDYDGTAQDRQKKFLVENYGYDSFMSLNDMEYAKLEELGYDGSLNDKWHKYIIALGGSGLGVKAQLLSSTFYVITDPYKVNNFSPELTTDFISQYYRTGGSESTLTQTITHNSATAGNATMVDSDGVLKWRPHNLFSYSEQFDNGVWKNNGTAETVGEAAPDGNNDAARVQGTSSFRTFYQNGPLVLGQTYTVSFYVKSYSGADQTFAIFLDNAGTSSDLTATSQWQLFSLTATATRTGNYPVGIADGSGSLNYDIVIWGAQLYRSDLGGMVDVPSEERAFAGATTYVPTTSSARYLPRIGHHVYNGSQWVNEGLLHESEARTNAQENSNVFTGAGNATITVDQAVSPDGTTNASLYDENVANSANAGLFGTATVSAGVAYTNSVFVKYKSGSGWVALCHRGSSAANQFFAWFDIQNGVVGSNQGGSGTMSYDNHGIEDCGNGWYRIYTVGTDSGSTTYNAFVISAPSDNNSNRETDAEFYIYGAQLEAGSTPSSYIPTSGNTVTRSAETLTIEHENLPWPSPVVIGEELVTGGEFNDAGDLTDWSPDDDGTNSIVDGELQVSTGVTGVLGAYQVVSGFTAGKV